MLGGFLSTLPPSDWHALFTRHNVEMTEFDANNPLSVGNGGLLYAIVMMAEGLDDGKGHASGFTEDGEN